MKINMGINTWLTIHFTLGHLEPLNQNNMTPKLKAENLVDTYRIILMNEDTECGEEILCTVISKKCALIAVDEIIDALEKYDELTEKHLKDEFDVTYFSCELQNMDSDFRYWQEVKQEIINI
jgi:hypothetical protein